MSRFWRFPWALRGSDPSSGALAYRWPHPRPGRWRLEAAALLAALASSLTLLDQLILLPNGPSRALLGLSLLGSSLAAAALGYALRRDLSLAYVLEPSGLRVSWGWGEERLPYGGMRFIEPREEAIGQPRFRRPFPLLDGFREGHWPQGGPVRDYATRQEDQVVVVAGERIYLFSPREREAFLAELRRRREESPAGGEARLHRGLWEHPLWRDRAALSILGMGLLLNGLLFFLVTWFYPQIPSVVALGFDSLGRVRWVTPRVQIYLLPVTGLALVAGNAALAWRWLDGAPLAARQLLAGGVLAHGLLLLSAWRLLS